MTVAVRTAVSSGIVCAVVVEVVFRGVDAAGVVDAAVGATDFPPVSSIDRVRHSVAGLCDRATRTLSAPTSRAVGCPSHWCENDRLLACQTLARPTFGELYPRLAKDELEVFRVVVRRIS